MKKALLAIAVSIALAGGIQAGNDHDDDHHSDHFEFKPGTLVLTRSVYVGTPSLLVPGVTVLPPGCVGGTTGISVTVPLIAGGTTPPIAVPCIRRKRRWDISHRLQQRRYRRPLRHHLSDLPGQPYDRWPSAGHASDPDRSDCDQLQLEIRAGPASVHRWKVGYFRGLPRRPGIPDRGETSSMSPMATRLASSTQPMPLSASITVPWGKWMPMATS